MKIEFSPQAALLHSEIIQRWLSQPPESQLDNDLRMVRLQKAFARTHPRTNVFALNRVSCG